MWPKISWDRTGAWMIEFYPSFFIQFNFIRRPKVSSVITETTHWAKGYMMAWSRCSVLKEFLAIDVRKVTTTQEQLACGGQVFIASSLFNLSMWALPIIVMHDSPTVGLYTIVHPCKGTWARFRSYRIFINIQRSRDHYRSRTRIGSGPRNQIRPGREIRIGSGPRIRILTSRN